MPYCFGAVVNRKLRSLWQSVEKCAYGTCSCEGQEASVSNRTYFAKLRSSFPELSAVQVTCSARLQVSVLLFFADFCRLQRLVAASRVGFARILLATVIRSEASEAWLNTAPGSAELGKFCCASLLVFKALTATGSELSPRSGRASLGRALLLLSALYVMQGAHLFRWARSSVKSNSQVE